ncbi:hypothetical protein NMG60_11017200 [Bertholletia excelsa]
MALSGAEGDKYRAHLHGEGKRNTKWRFGAPPNYDVVNKLFEEGRTKVWPAGSLEEKVQNLVKTWEMEMFHKTCFDDYKTVDPIKYRFSLNGRKAITLEEKRKLGGGYNSLLQTSLPEKFRCYNPDEETVLQVYSGPPVITYKFRHWGIMDGQFKGHAPTGELVEFYGMAVFELDEQSKIVKVEFFYDRGELLGALMEGSACADELPSSCPFLKNTG